MKIPRRKLGPLGLEVSAIGLGCVGMSDFYGPSDEATNLRLLNAALDIGINFLDTADIYGVGANECLLAKVLKTRREEIVLATKFGRVRGPEGAFLGINGTPEYVHAACDASLSASASIISICTINIGSTRRSQSRKQSAPWRI